MNGIQILFLCILISGLSFAGGLATKHPLKGMDTLWNDYLKTQCYIQHKDAYRDMDQYWCEGERIVIYTK